MQNHIVTPQSIWRDWDNDSPLSTSVIKEGAIGLNFVKEVYFGGTKLEDGTTRIYGKLTYRKGLTRPPVIALVGDTKSYLGGIDIEQFLGAGYAVLEFDYAGEHPQEARYTMYPKSLEHCNYHKYPEAMYSMTQDPKASCLYEWTCICRRAVKLLTTLTEIDNAKIALLGVGNAAHLVWRTVALESTTLIGGAILLGSDNTKASTDATDNNSLRFVAALDPKNYLTFLGRPIFVELASDSEDGYYDKMSDYFGWLDTKCGSLISVTERSMHMVGLKQQFNIAIFIGNLFDVMPLPERPTLKAKQSEGALYFDFVSSNPNLEIASIEFFCSYGKTDPQYRNWTNLTPIYSGEGEYIAKVPVFDPTNIIQGFATVAYTNGYSLSTRLVSKLPLELGITEIAPISKSRLIYDSDMGIDCFVAGSNSLYNIDTTLLGITVAPNLYMTESSLTIINGPHDIEGVSAVTGELVTNKLGDVRYRAQYESILQLNLCSWEAGDITIVAIKDNKTAAKAYIATRKTSGYKTWDKLTLSPSDFKTQDGNLDSFEDIVQLRIISSPISPAIVSTILWV